MTLKYSKILAVCSITSLSLMKAEGANYSIDFSGFASPGGNWNVIGSGNGTSSLVDFDTGLMDGSVITRLGLVGDSNISNGWSAGTVDWMVDAAGSDGLYSGNTASVTVSNLTPGTYRVMLVAAEAASGGSTFPSTADFQVNAAFADSDRLSTGANGDDWHTENDGVNNWMEWASVSSTGTITVSIDASATGFTTVNALRIESLTVIPEPSSLLLSGLGVLAFLSRRKRS